MGTLRAIILLGSFYMTSVIHDYFLGCRASQPFYRIKFGTATFLVSKPFDRTLATTCLLVASQLRVGSFYVAAIAVWKLERAFDRRSSVVDTS